MFEADEQGIQISKVEISEFSRSLFSFLYEHYFHMCDYVGAVKEHFIGMIGRACCFVEKRTHDFNFCFLHRFDHVKNSQLLCKKIIELYPDDDYFRSLYYLTVFIFHIIYRNHIQYCETDYNRGPILWVRIFRWDFASEFANRGGFRGFAEAGEIMMHKEDVDAYLLPISYKSRISSIKELFVVDDKKGVEKEFRIMEVAIQEAEASEQDVEMQVDEDPDLPEGAMGGMDHERFQRKRRHDESSSDSEAEQDLPTASRIKLEKEVLI